MTVVSAAGKPMLTPERGPEKREGLSRRATLPFGRKLPGLPEYLPATTSKDSWETH